MQSNSSSRTADVLSDSISCFTKLSIYNNTFYRILTVQPIISPMLIFSNAIYIVSVQTGMTVSHSIVITGQLPRIHIDADLGEQTRGRDIPSENGVGTLTSIFSQSFCLLCACVI